MTVALALLRRYWLPVLLLIVVAYSIVAAYGRGYKASEAEWQGKWDSALASAAKEQQAITLQRVEAAEKNAQRAQDELDRVKRDSDVALEHADGLRDAAAARVARLSASLSTCSAAASKAAAENVRVFADVFRRADEAAGRMAAVADQALTRGETCQRQYEVIRSTTAQPR